MKKIFSVNTELYKVTGVQKVLMDIHHAVMNEYDAKIVGTIPYNQIHNAYGIGREEYIRFKNPFMFYKSIVVVHERKLLLLFWLLNHVLFQRIRLVYVHHNIMYGWKWMPMPKCVIAISDRCGENLRTYFKVKEKYIHKIFNCVDDIHPLPHKAPSSNEIRILLPARINGQKRQIEIVKKLRGKLSRNIKILFAGIGPHYEELKKMVRDDSQFMALGFRNDIPQLLQQCDYMMLFSAHEGLPITLIEATMCGTPIVCNDVGGNLEIAHDGENAFVTNDWKKLADILNSLPNIPKEEYMRLSRNSRNIYERNFTFNRFKSNYLKLIEETLKKS